MQIYENICFLSSNCLNFADSFLIIEMIIFKTKNKLSSYLSHYHPYDRAKTIDGHFLDYIHTDRIQNLYEAHKEGIVEACGFGPMMSFFNSLKNIYKNPIKPKKITNNSCITRSI